MSNQTLKNIVLPKSAVQEDGIVILPLKKWKEVEDSLEDLEMYRSETLAEEIEKRRKEKETVSLEELFKKYHI